MKNEVISIVFVDGKNRNRLVNIVSLNKLFEGIYHNYQYKLWAVEKPDDTISVGFFSSYHGLNTWRLKNNSENTKLLFSLDTQSDSGLRTDQVAYGPNYFNMRLAEMGWEK